MNKKKHDRGSPAAWAASAVVAFLASAGPAHAQSAVEAGVLSGNAGTMASPPGTRAVAQAPRGGGGRAQTSATVDPPRSNLVCAGELGAPVSVELVTGKSTLVKLPAPINVRTLGDEDVVQARLLGPQALYLLGVGLGTTNMILQDANGNCTIVEISVGMDVTTVRSKLAQLMPEERDIRVSSAADSIVLSGEVSDVTRVDQAVMVANAFVRQSLDGGRIGGGGREGTSGLGQAGAGQAQGSLGRQSPRVVNLLTVTAPQQVLLEVKVAEVSKQLIDKLGASVNLSRVNGDWAYTLLTDFLSGGAGMVDIFRRLTGEYITIDAEKRDGLVKILAAPNLMAISGQEGSFLAGGKVFFPVAQGNVAGVATITLVEQEFGIGLRFTPTVLAGGRINLKVTPEVSELSPEGVAIQAVQVAGRTIAPVINTRRASTTIQLYDGQTFAIGGLIKNNANTDVKRFPLLGEIPVIGALFRSTAFQTDRSELLFVVTPHLVKPMAGSPRLPTDNYIEPNRMELFLDGKLEGKGPPPPASAPAPSAPPPSGGGAPSGPTGFQPK